MRQECIFSRKHYLTGLVRENIQPYLGPEETKNFSLASCLISEYIFLLEPLKKPLYSIQQIITNGKLENKTYYLQILHQKISHLSEGKFSSRTNIRAYISQVFSEITTKELIFERNTIDHFNFIISYLVHMPKLNSISFNCIHVTKAIIDRLRALPQLKSLAISNCILLEGALVNLKDCTKLKKLKIKSKIQARDEIKPADIQHIKNCTTIKKLTLSLWLNDYMIQLLREMSLKKLSLKYSSGIFRPLSNLGSSSQLEELNLSCIDIKSEDIIENINNFSKIRTLKIEECIELNDKCLNAIVHLMHLRKFYICANNSVPITKEAILSFLQATETRLKVFRASDGNIFKARGITSIRRQYLQSQFSHDLKRQRIK